MSALRSVVPANRAPFIKSKLLTAKCAKAAKLNSAKQFFASFAIFAVKSFDFFITMSDFCHFVPAHIRKLAENSESKPLKQAGSGSKPIALNLDENPFGPSPLAIKAIQSVLDKTNRYPEIQASDLHEAIADSHAISRDQVLVTAGATELLCMIARALLAPGLNAISHE